MAWRYKLEVNNQIFYYDTLVDLYKELNEITSNDFKMYEFDYNAWQLSKDEIYKRIN